jgi:hypothetical protein
MPNKIKKNQPETPYIPQGRDLFQTPNYATELLVPFIPKRIRWIWEPACGKGKISDVLLHYDFNVYSSDLGFPNAEDNFLTCDYPFPTYKVNSAIITNPPYSLKQKFWNRCRYFEVPFALLIPADYCGWVIEALMQGAEKIIPTRRIDFITPSGKSGLTGNTSNYHSLWLTWGFGLGRSETFVELTNDSKKHNV